MKLLKLVFPVAIAAGALVATTIASARPAAPTARVAAAAPVSCKSQLKIAFVTPLTGGAGFLGQEQLSWAKYAIKVLPKQFGFNMQLVTGDTPVEQGGAPAQALAQKFVADKSVVAILGPSTSGGVASSS